MISSKRFRQRDDKLFLRISPDAKFLAICLQADYFRNNSLNIYDETGQLVFYIPRRKESYHEDTISDVFDISPNGRYLAVCYHESYGSVYGSGCYLWDTEQKMYLENFVQETMEYKSYLSGNGGQGYHYLDIRFLPDNDRLITVSDMGEIFAWSISQRKQLWAISAAAHQANSVAFSNKIGLFAMCDRQDKSWRHGQIGQHTTVYSYIHYRVAHELLNVGHSFRLWNIYSGTLIREFDADYLVSDLVFSHDDKLIAGSMRDRADIRDTAFIWDVNTGEVVDALPKNTKPIGFTANDSYLIVIHEGKNISLWDLQTKQWQRRFELEGVISSAQVSQSDKVVALSKTIDDWQLHQIQL